MEEKCPCQTDIHACCTCVSMHCDECHKPQQSKFIQGRFCSNCGRPLKAELIRVYVPKSEYDSLQKIFNELKQEAKGYLNRIYGIRADVAREIFEDIERLLELYTVNTPIHMPFNYIDILFVHYVAELKKKYTESEE